MLSWVYKIVIFIVVKPVNNSVDFHLSFEKLDITLHNDNILFIDLEYVLGSCEVT